MDSVLMNLNQLNRSLESVIAVGNEFGSVEALWSMFEGVMGDQTGGQQQQQQQQAEGGASGGGDQQQRRTGNDEEEGEQPRG
jgi:DASH complex subunit DAD1